MTSLLLVATPAILASLVVLALGPVGASAWALQAASIALAVCAAASGAAFAGRVSPSRLAGSILLLGLLALAVTLGSGRPGPTRWLALGPLNLYVAPVVLPAFLAACSAWIVARGKRALWACVALVTASALLGLQPDASQALGLLVAMAVVLVHCRCPGWLSGSTLGVAALTTAWAFLQPDPLQPLPHVEEVFALAFAHSWLIGVAVLASAIWLVVGLHARASRAQPWLSAVAAYYGVLFACSTAGLTPAPLIGLGAGPVVGFGLLLAATATLGAAGRAAQGPSA